MTIYNDNRLQREIDALSGVIITTSGDIVAQIGEGGVTYEQLVTTSGDLLAQIENSIAVGNNVFSISGTLISHDFNTLAHCTNITPTVSTTDDAIKIGVVYVSKGLNADTVYMTGGPDAEGLTFMWESTVAVDLPDNQIVIGNNSFSDAGTTITHNFNSTTHSTVITPTVTEIIDATKIGTIYVSKGLNEDVVYMTGGATASGLPFMWSVMT